jgi:hypothetical protein
LFQKSGAAMRFSRDFRRSRWGAASKITPNHRDTRLQEFIAVLKIFENHEIDARVKDTLKLSAAGYQRRRNIFHRHQQLLARSISFPKS